MVYAVIIIVVGIIVSLLACFKISGDCSRNEEREKHRKTAEEGYIKDADAPVQNQ